MRSLVGTLGLWLLFRYGLAPSGSTSPKGLVFFGIAFGAVFIARALARAVSRFVIPPERVLFVGGGPVARVLARKLRLHPEYELEPIGYVDTVESTRRARTPASSTSAITSDIDLQSAARSGDRTRPHPVARGRVRTSLPT